MLWTVEMVSLAEDLQVAISRIGEQTDRADKVLKSLHDFVRRRDQAPNWTIDVAATGRI